MKRIISILMLCMLSSWIFAQVDLTYQQPHESIMALADAPMPPAMSLSDDGQRALLMYRKQYKSIAELSETELRLGGLRINPLTNISSRARYYYQLRLFDPAAGEEHEISGIPENAKMTNISWSPAQDMIAFTNTVADGVELWYIDYSQKKANKLTDADLNANMGNPATWLKDGSGFLVNRLPNTRKNLVDVTVSVPTGPTVSVNEEGNRAQNRTYQDLLKNPNDEANFEVLAQSEIWKLGLDGQMEKWKDAGMYRNISPSPDGNYFMVTEVSRPFSYIVPYSRFPTAYNIYDAAGSLVKTIAEVPLMEEMPQGFMATREGPRSISWRADAPATVVWAEALDGGDPENEVAFRDEVFQLSAPFDGEKTSLVKTKLRYSGIQWGSEEVAVIMEYWWNTRTMRTSFFNPTEPKNGTTLYNERNYQDQYSDPGSFVTTRNEYGRYTLDLQKSRYLHLIGDGYSPEGKLPFVDRYDLRKNETKRLYRASPDEMLEDIVRMMDAKEGTLLTRLESSSLYPNYYIRNIKNGEIKQLTDFENPFKSLQDVHKEVITYERYDGLELSGTLYLPVGYDKEAKEKMPMILWAYPREYKDKSSASQVTASSNKFTYPYYGSPIYWVTRGYVVLDGAAFPIIGEGEEEPNDSFREQLVGNAKAAIDAVDKMGYIDRSKVAVGGHSYGAFMTANLLAHSDLFAAGIARSGAYNRTLTPFGFQSEERNYWEAPEVYYDMSPFMHADKMKTPLLLIHGQADNNSGTYPMQSERYFNALKGLGAPVRLVMLPKESHGYTARESIMHMLWEQDQWLERYVKNRPME